MVLRQVPLAKWSFCKSAVRISMYFGEIMKGQSVIFQVIFHIDGDFNNSRKEKIQF